MKVIKTIVNLIDPPQLLFLSNYCPIKYKAKKPTTITITITKKQ